MSISRYADLHLHTFFSDGTFSPKELVGKAKAQGFSCIAITDHDTVEAIAPATKLSKAAGLEIIPAIELTAQIDNCEFHILGYFIDWKNKAFLNKLKELRASRIARIYEMVGKLKSLGVDIETDEVLTLAGKGTAVGRPHVARVLYNKGIIQNISEAFTKFIGDKGPAYVARFRLTPKQVIDLIIANNGIPVLAHPHNPGKDELIPQFIEEGLMGIEVYNPMHSPSISSRYEALALKYNLLITGGSDCHGQAKDEMQIGKIKLPYPFVEELKKRKATL